MSVCLPGYVYAVFFILDVLAAKFGTGIQYDIMGGICHFLWCLLNTLCASSDIIVHDTIS